MLIFDNTLTMTKLLTPYPRFLMQSSAVRRQMRRAQSHNYTAEGNAVMPRVNRAAEGGGHSSPSEELLSGTYPTHHSKGPSLPHSTSFAERSNAVPPSPAGRAPRTSRFNNSSPSHKRVSGV